MGTIEVLGVRIHDVTVDGLHAHIADCIRDRRHASVLNVNAHGLNLSYANSRLRNFLNSASLVFGDGVGVAVAARMLGHSPAKRIPVTDWIWELVDFAEARGFSIFLLAGRPGVAELARDRLLEHHAALRIAGTHHGYFDKRADGTENREVVSLINQARPDILLVGFGMPLQERWLEENWDAIDAHVALTGGAVLDYTSGVLRRGPRLLTQHGFEWLARLIIEPRRLWKRYLIGIPLFLWRVHRQRLAYQSNRAHVGPEEVALERFEPGS